MSKIKVSFEINDNYNRQEFRDFVKKLSTNDPCLNCIDYEVELYIITSNTDQNYVYTVAKQYNIDTIHIAMLPNLADKIQFIKDNNIEITFENSQEIVNSINNQTDAFSILVDSTIDFYLMGFKYISKFNNVLKIIENEKKEKNC